MTPLVPATPPHTPTSSVLSDDTGRSSVAPLIVRTRPYRYVKYASKADAFDAIEAALPGVQYVDGLELVKHDLWPNLSATPPLPAHGLVALVYRGSYAIHQLAAPHTLGAHVVTVAWTEVQS